MRPSTPSNRPLPEPVLTGREALSPLCAGAAGVQTHSLISTQPLNTEQLWAAGAVVAMWHDAAIPDFGSGPGRACLGRVGRYTSCR